MKCVHVCVSVFVCVCDMSGFGFGLGLGWFWVRFGFDLRYVHVHTYLTFTLISYACILHGMCCAHAHVILSIDTLHVYIYTCIHIYMIM